MTPDRLEGYAASSESGARHAVGRDGPGVGRVDGR